MPLVGHNDVVEALATNPLHVWILPKFRAEESAYAD